MSDPFDVLREARASDVVPDVAAIKGRAKRIRQRQRLAVGASAAGVAVIALIAVMVSTGPTPRSTDLAQTQRESVDKPERSAIEDSAASIGSAPEGYEDTTDDEVAAPVEAGSSAARGSQTAPFNLTATVKAAPAAGGQTKLTIEVCNVYEDDHVRTFPDSQRYDFVVARGDENVWTWSQGRLFAQVVGEETWGPKECRRWTDMWDGKAADGSPAPPGEYSVTGVLAGEPELRTDPATFCHGLC